MPSEAEQYGKAGTPKRRIGFFQVLSCLSIKPIKTRLYLLLILTNRICGNDGDRVAVIVD
ncbi:hypothetical protein [Neisseria meningitidis]|uniref:hypothetical protein n=1 Tax=Neisseria meningitidis TaxID=487 RepID=UPI000ACD12E5|nr:hypothetical protein [Neisseria meningitidis]